MINVCVCLSVFLCPLASRDDECKRSLMTGAFRETITMATTNLRGENNDNNNSSSSKLISDVWLHISDQCNAPWVRVEDACAVRDAPLLGTDGTQEQKDRKSVV